VNEVQEKSTSIKENSHPLRVFLCHSSGDKPSVRDLFKRLQKDGFDPWLDEEKLLPGQKWRIEIPKAVKASDVVIVCLSNKSINKEGYIQKEIKYVLDAADEKPEGTIFLIPLKLEECDVPERLCDWHWVNIFEENGYEKLIRSLKQRAETISADNDRGFKPEIEFVLIPAGEFDMGSPSNEAGGWGDYEGPVHHVKISKAFYLGKYEITQKQWRDVMGSSPSYFKGDDLPVEMVSWNDVQDFLKKLNEKEASTKYRLPSEAEWEYAARAGTTTRYSFGDDEKILGDYAWYDANSGSKTHDVGQKKPNPWGLYDMHGNVWEWVQDCWHGDYNGAPTDGSSWESGDDSYRVNRGGGWNDSARYCRSANRVYDDPDYRNNNLGFRLVRVL